MMACSGKNIVKNGEFNDGLANWSGSIIKLVDNPLSKGNKCVLMGNKNTVDNPKLMSVLKQDIKGPFERGCAYYLHYQLMHAILLEPADRFYATVAYLDYRRRIIRSTPVYIIPNHSTLRWFEYYSIIPPAPPNAVSCSVSFLLRGGMMYIDYIRLVSQTIKPVPKEDIQGIQDEKDEQVINPDAI